MIFINCPGASARGKEKGMKSSIAPGFSPGQLMKKAKPYGASL